MHNALVTAAGEKMSKSLGNSMQVRVVLEKVRRIELRWYLGSAHYRSILEYSPESLEESATAFRRIENFLARASATLGKIPSPRLSDQFTNAMNDDLAVPQGLAQISEALRVGNIALTSGDLLAIDLKAGEIRGALDILGCDPYDPAFIESEDADLGKVLSGVIELALSERIAARERKDFAASDQIRDVLGTLGVNVEDTPQGPRWSLKTKEER